MTTNEKKNISHLLLMFYKYSNARQESGNE
jgi:hypothetical protein